MPALNDWAGLWAACLGYLEVLLPFLALVWGFLILSMLGYWWANLARPGQNANVLGMVGQLVRIARSGRSAFWAIQSFFGVLPAFRRISGGGLKGAVRAVRRSVAYVQTGRRGETSYDQPLNQSPIDTVGKLPTEERAKATPGIDDIDFVRRYG